MANKLYVEVEGEDHLFEVAEKDVCYAQPDVLIVKLPEYMRNETLGSLIRHIGKDEFLENALRIAEDDEEVQKLKDLHQYISHAVELYFNPEYNPGGSVELKLGRVVIKEKSGKIIRSFSKVEIDKKSKKVMGSGSPELDNEPLTRFIKTKSLDNEDYDIIELAFYIGNVADI